MGNINTLVAYPDLNTLRAAYGGNYAIPIREIVYQDGNNNVQPVTALADSGNKAQNQQNLAAAFLGLSHERKVTTDLAGTVEVDRTAVVQMQCPALASAAPVGTLVAASPGGSGTALQSQLVEPTTLKSCAIGQVAEPAVVGQTFLKVFFFSSVNPISPPSLEVTATLAAQGSNAANTGAITAQATIVTTTGNNQGVSLPTFPAGTYAPRYLKNSDATNTVNVYPPTGSSIDAGSVNAALAIAPLRSVLFVPKATTGYYSLLGATS